MNRQLTAWIMHRKKQTTCANDDNVSETHCD